ncbi:hypothetical protein R6Z07F_019027 [Ovis aries]
MGGASRGPPARGVGLCAQARRFGAGCSCGLLPVPVRSRVELRCLRPRRLRRLHPPNRRGCPSAAQRTERLTPGRPPHPGGMPSQVWTVFQEQQKMSKCQKCAGQGPMSFKDMTVDFTRDEWVLHCQTRGDHQAGARRRAVAIKIPRLEWFRQRPLSRVQLFATPLR